MEILNKLKNIKIPWVIGLRKPKFVFDLPKIDLTEDTNKIAIYSLLTFFISLMAGGFIYMLVNNPPAIASDNQGNPVIVLKGLINLDKQTLLEGLTVIALILMSSIGLFILRRSTEVATEEEARNLWLYGGIFLAFFGLFGLAVLLGVKISP